MFGLAEMQSLLSDKYVILRFIVNSSEAGWPIDRVRQYCVGILRQWIFPLLEARPAQPHTLRTSDIVCGRCGRLRL